MFMAPAALTLIGDKLWPNRRAERSAQLYTRVQEPA